MFSPAMILANAKINQLHAEAAAQRLAKKSRNARGESRGTGLSEGVWRKPDQGSPQGS